MNYGAGFGRIPKLAPIRFRGCLNNNVLNGIDADLSGILNGNGTAVDDGPDVNSNVDADTSADSTTDGGQDNEGLLGGLL